MLESLQSLRNSIARQRISGSKRKVTSADSQRGGTIYCSCRQNELLADRAQLAVTQ